MRQNVLRKNIKILPKHSLAAALLKLSKTLDRNFYIVEAYI